MKNIGGILTLLKGVVKYGAFIAVGVKIVQYAHDEIKKCMDENSETKTVVENEQKLSE